MGRVQDMFSDLPWASFKEFVDTRGCNVQWVDVKGAYYLMAKDGDVVAECMFGKEEPAHDDQVEFETNYKNLGNKKQAVTNESTGSQRVSIEKADDSSTTLISHDWCDPSSWSTESIKVTGKVLVQDAGKVYDIPGDALIIDLIHGRKTDEDEISAPYLFKLTDDGTELTEDTDYVVDYKLGKVTMDDSYTVVGALVADYHKADGSCYIFEPTPGKNLVLEHPELNFSKDCFINTHIIFEVWVGNPYFNPANPIVDWTATSQFGVDNFLRFPYKRKIYKNEKDLINAANLGQGSIPQFGNLAHDTLVFPFNYVTTTTLKASDMAQLRICLKKDKDGKNIPLTGSFGTVSFYVVSLNE